jgi:hypothetical protein
MKIDSIFPSYFSPPKTISGCIHWGEPALILFDNKINKICCDARSIGMTYWNLTGLVCIARFIEAFLLYCSS